MPFFGLGLQAVLLSLYESTRHWWELPVGEDKFEQSKLDQIVEEGKFIGGKSLILVCCKYCEKNHIIHRSSNN